MDLWAEAHEKTKAYHEEVPFKDTLEAALPLEGGRVRVDVVRMFLGIEEKETVPNRHMGQAMKVLGWENKQMRLEGGKLPEGKKDNRVRFYIKNYVEGDEEEIVLSRSDGQNSGDEITSAELNAHKPTEEDGVEQQSNGESNVVALRREPPM